MKSESCEKKTGAVRLASLDALRGFDMFWILYPTYPIVRTLLKAMGLTDCWLYGQLNHYPWNGFTFYDTIYPLFLFMAGVSFPFSFDSSRAKGMGYGRISWKIIRRAIILILLGSTIFGSLKLDFEKLTLCSVLGRIGISCGAASFIWMFVRSNRARLAVCASILLIYWLLPFFVPCPGAPEGALAYAAKETCLYSWLDGNFFPRPLFGAGFAGLFPMTATALMGMFAGEWLKRPASEVSGERKTLGLIAAGVIALATGLLIANAFGDWSCPVNKPIWSSSYALVSGAYSFLMLAVFYWIIDVRGKAAWSFPFRVIGMNAVFAYLASRTVFPWKMEMNFLFGGVMSFFPPEWGAFVGELLYVAVYWLLLLLMYRKGIFLKA